MNLKISGSTKVIGEPLTLIKPLPALTWATAVADFFLPKVCIKKEKKRIISIRLIQCESFYKYVFDLLLVNLLSRGKYIIEKDIRMGVEVIEVMDTY